MRAQQLSEQTQTETLGYLSRLSDIDLSLFHRFEQESDRSGTIVAAIEEEEEEEAAAEAAAAAAAEAATGSGLHEPGRKLHQKAVVSAGMS